MIPAYFPKRTTERRKDERNLKVQVQPQEYVTSGPQKLDCGDCMKTPQRREQCNLKMQMNMQARISITTNKSQTREYTEVMNMQMIAEKIQAIMISCDRN